MNQTTDQSLVGGNTRLAPLFSSATDEWETPQDFFDSVDAEFHFTVDVCATPENTKCPVFYTKEMDGLKQDWRGVCWMNPPYGRTIANWVEKASRSASENGATVVCLLPSRTDTRWWHDYIWNKEKHQPKEGVEVRLIQGRLKFGGAKSAAPFPSVLVIFHPKA